MIEITVENDAAQKPRKGSARSVAEALDSFASTNDACEHPLHRRMLKDFSEVFGL
jgi:hypothetical protein